MQCCSWMDCFTPNNWTELCLLVLPLLLLCIQISLNSTFVTPTPHVMIIFYGMLFLIFFYIVSYACYRHKEECSMFHSVCAYRSWLRSIFTIYFFITSGVFAIYTLLFSPPNCQCLIAINVIISVTTPLIFALQCRGLGEQWKKINRII